MKTMMHIKSIAIKAAPMPIPAFALVERPLLPVGDAGELVADGRFELDGQESEPPGQLVEATVGVLVGVVVDAVLAQRPPE
jgi:hypothetical protein